MTAHAAKPRLGHVPLSEGQQYRIVYVNGFVRNSSWFDTAGSDLLCGAAPEVGDPSGGVFRLEPGAGADQVGEDSHRMGVFEGGEAVEAEGVEVVAGKQGEVGVVAGEEAGLLVVEKVALAHRLGDEPVLAAAGQLAELRALGRVDDVRSDRRVLDAKLIRKRLQCFHRSASSRASAAA